MEGLNDPIKLDTVQNYVKRYIFKIDIICIQGHKLKGLKIVVVKYKFLPKADFFNQEVVTTYNHIDNGKKNR